MSKVKSTVFGLIVALISAILIVPYALGYSSYKIGSRHMLPTMEVGDYLVIDDDAYDEGDYRMGDLIIYASPRELNVVMVGRVVALPGSVIEIKDGQRYISGDVIEESYIDPSRNKREQSVNFGPYNVPEGSVFVLGDNRDNSFDSRTFGHISTESVMGKVIKIY